MEKKCEKRRQAWVKLNINPSFIRQLIIFIKRRSWWNAIITVYRSNLPWFNKLINAHLVSRARKWFGNENVMYVGYILVVISENCFLFWRFLLLFRFASNDFEWILTDFNPRINWIMSTKVNKTTHLTCLSVSRLVKTSTLPILNNMLIMILVKQLITGIFWLSSLVFKLY